MKRNLKGISEFNRTLDKAMFWLVSDVDGSRTYSKKSEAVDYRKKRVGQN